MERILNAKITGVSISMADHGCLTFYIILEGSGWGCSFGGYCIASGYLGSNNFVAENGHGLEAMMRIMDTVGVEKWEDLEGKYVRVEFNNSQTINKIGNLLKDKWFSLEEFFSSKQKSLPVKPRPKDVSELRDFVAKALKEHYAEVDPRVLDDDIIVRVEEYVNGRNDVWIQFPYFHSR